MEYDQDKELAQSVARYAPSTQALASVRQVPVLLAVGITAAGKDTVLRRLTELYPNDYQFTVSHTTRPMRENNGVMEQDGSPYYFIDKSAAIQMLDKGAFVETNLFATNLYGMSIAELGRAGSTGRILVTDMDVNGVANFVRLGLNVKSIFLLPPSFEVWQQRLHARHKGTFNTDDLRKRLQIALAELENAIAHDYFYLVVNNDLDQTVALVDGIAHGRPSEARNAQAMSLAQELISKLTSELA